MLVSAAKAAVQIKDFFIDYLLNLPDESSGFALTRLLERLLAGVAPDACVSVGTPMKANLEQLRQEAVDHLKERGLVVFKSLPHSRELASETVYWDSESYPDFREFIAAAEAAGVRLISVCGLEFHAEVIDDALEQLETASLDRDVRRSIESRLRELKGYEGFICEVELSFSHDARTYVFAQSTPWYDEAGDLLEQIEDAFEPSEENPMGGGYYSNN
jgi:hypothetical protein